MNLNSFYHIMVGDSALWHREEFGVARENWIRVTGLTKRMIVSGDRRFNRTTGFQVLSEDVDARPNELDLKSWLVRGRVRPACGEGKVRLVCWYCCGRGRVYDFKGRLVMCESCLGGGRKDYDDKDRPVSRKMFDMRGLKIDETMKEVRGQRFSYWSMMSGYGRYPYWRSMYSMFTPPTWYIDALNRGIRIGPFNPGFARHVDKEKELRERVAKEGKPVTFAEGTPEFEVSFVGCDAPTLNDARRVNGYEPIEGGDRSLNVSVGVRVRRRGLMSLLPAFMALAGVDSLEELEKPPWWKDEGEGPGSDEEETEGDKP